MSFRAAGTCAPSYSAGALLAAMAGVDLLHVPYRGGGEALIAVLTGETQLLSVRLHQPYRIYTVAGYSYWR